MLAVEYQGKRLDVNTISDIDRVQKFIAEYRRHLTEAQRLAEAEALLFSAPSAAPAPDLLTENAQTVETAQTDEALPAVAADIVSAPPDPLPSPARRRPHLPPIGQRTVDYLLRALAAGTGTMLKTEMQAAVQALGWTTRARTKHGAQNTLYAAVAHFPLWIASERERITITEVGRVFVQTLPPLPAVSNTTPEVP